MKIAVPTNNDTVDEHFGHCEYYTIFTVENNQITDKQLLPSLPGCGCKSNIIPVLQNIGVNVMLAGNMGDGAKDKLESHNIKVIRGCSGNIRLLVTDYLNGKIADSGERCHHHDGEACNAD